MSSVPETTLGPATMVVRPQIFFACPHCGADDEHSVTHFIGKGATSFGPWQCDACGWVVSGQWNDVTQTVTITEIKERPTPIDGYLLLRLAPSKANRPVYFVVEDKIYTRDRDLETVEQEMEHKRYWVEEHTCPTNIIRIEAMIETASGYNDDPHGVLEFVSWAPRPASLSDGEEPHWPDLFPCLRREIDGELAPQPLLIEKPSS